MWEDFGLLDATALIVVAVLLALPYTAGPLFAWLVFRQRPYSMSPIQPALIPIEAWRFFASVAPDLAVEGFTAAGYMGYTGYMYYTGGVYDTGATIDGGGEGRVKLYVAVWAHAARGQTASLVAVVAKDEPTKTYVSFETTAAVPLLVVSTSS
jgi:hypothetical protein